MIYQILYFSIATEQNIEEDVLKEILEVSRKNNTKIGVTGMLVALDNCFLQVLEGEKKTVETLYQKIYKDDRHFKVVPIYQGETLERDFPNWSMGYKSSNIKELKTETGYINVSDKDFVEKHLKNTNRKVIRLIKRFYSAV